MATSELIENYLIDSDYSYEKINENTWTIHDKLDDIDNIIVYQEDDFVIFQVRLMTIPTSNQAEFFEKILLLKMLRRFLQEYPARQQLA